MTSVSTPMMVPPLRLPAPSAASTDQVDASSRRRPLPLPCPVDPQIRGTGSVYGLAAVDHRGRLADKVLIAALGWEPGIRLAARERGGLLILSPAPSGSARLTLRGHLQLPQAVRRWIGLSPADRVLLAADPADRSLVIHPPASLDAMIIAYHASRLGGDAA